MTRFNTVTALSVVALALSAFPAPSSAWQQAAEFNHQSRYVRDVKKSAAFYETVLGLKRIQDPFRDDLHVWFRVGEHGQLHITGGATEVLSENIRDHMAFKVPSVQDFVTRLGQLKIEYFNLQHEAGKIAVRVDGVKQVYLKDPDGYWIEVNEDRY
jgi:lactoylglutathione lyase